MAWAVVVAAGRGERMGLGRNKVLADLKGVPILARSLKALLICPQVAGLVLVISPGDEAEIRAILKAQGLDGRVNAIAYGGDTRQASVQNGLSLVPASADFVLVHDAARPLVTPEVIRHALGAAAQHGAAVPGVAVKDTIKQVDDQGKVIATPHRAQLRAVQTPQAFEARLLRRAHHWGRENSFDAPDDGLLVEGMGHPVLISQGDVENIKITTPEDLAIAQAILAKREGDRPMRVGQGYDVHRLVEGRRLILLGAVVPYEKGLLGHSDADVAAHALSDALLGALALGDIGRHFPDTDPAYAGADSMKMLAQVVAKVAAQGYRVANADVTIVAQRPKLAGFIPAMVANTARVLGVEADKVNVKATTTEGLGFEGEGLGISAQAVVLLERG